jgi:hypothetical protein
MVQVVLVSSYAGSRYLERCDRQAGIGAPRACGASKSLDTSEQHTPPRLQQQQRMRPTCFQAHLRRSDKGWWPLGRSCEAQPHAGLRQGLVTGRVLHFYA